MAKHRKKPQKSHQKATPQASGPSGMEQKFGAWGIDMKEVTFTKSPTKTARSAFKEVRRGFLQHLAENYSDELRKAGLSEAQIDTMRDQGRSPPNMNVHHKLPLSGGGKNVWDNLVLIPIEPHHSAIHRHSDPQIVDLGKGQSRTIVMAWPAGPIYAPKHPDMWKGRDMDAIMAAAQKGQRLDAPAQQQPSVSAPTRAPRVIESSAPVAQAPSAAAPAKPAADPAAAPAAPSNDGYGWALGEEDARPSRSLAPPSHQASAQPAASDDDAAHGWTLDGAETGSNPAPARPSAPKSPPKGDDAEGFGWTLGVSEDAPASSKGHRKPQKPAKKTWVESFDPNQISTPRRR